MFTSDNALQIIAIIIIGYLVGSMPTAYLVGKAKNINIFEVGSGSMGGTNVARSVGTGWAIFTGLTDVAKGIFAVWLARDIIMSDQKGLATTIAAIAVVAGHNWSLFAALLTASVQGGRMHLIFRGGKGAATAFGTMLMIQPFQILVASVVAIAIIARTRYVSLGVLIGFMIAIVWLVILVGTTNLQEPIILLYAIALTLMLLVRFRENIHRLRTGTERRLGESAS